MSLNTQNCELSKTCFLYKVAFSWAFHYNKEKRQIESLIRTRVSVDVYCIHGTRLRVREKAVLKSSMGFSNTNKLVTKFPKWHSLAWRKTGRILNETHFQSKIYSIITWSKIQKSEIDMDSNISVPAASTVHRMGIYSQLPTFIRPWNAPKSIQEG